MASSIVTMQWVLALMQLFLVLFCYKLGRGETGIAGTGLGYLPEPGGGARDGDGGHGAVTGGGDEHEHEHEPEPEPEPDEVVVKALQCFSEKHIYSGCDESYRLTASGQLHVPPEHTDEYCNGPCLLETHLVLNCIDDILSHFVFDNHATINDVKETIKIGCSQGSHRGDFKVAEHVEEDESNSYKPSYPILFGLPYFILVFNLLI